jgi:hypothetical protein
MATRPISSNKVIVQRTRLQKFENKLNSGFFFVEIFRLFGKSMTPSVIDTKSLRLLVSWSW